MVLALPVKHGVPCTAVRPTRLLKNPTPGDAQLAVAAALDQRLSTMWLTETAEVPRVVPEDRKNLVAARVLDAYFRRGTLSPGTATMKTIRREMQQSCQQAVLLLPPPDMLRDELKKLKGLLQLKWQAFGTCTIEECYRLISFPKLNALLLNLKPSITAAT